MYHSSIISDDESSGLFKTSCEGALVEAAQNGSQMAYIELCGRHRSMVFRAVQKVTNNREDAEDALQESWMKGFIHINTFSGRSAFATWLTRIAINSALMTMRKRRRYVEFSLDDQLGPDTPWQLELVEPSQSPEQQCIRNESQMAVRQAIKRLPPKLRKIVEIRQLHDGPVKHIASIAGISISATKSRLFRARVALNKPLKRLQPTRPLPVRVPRTPRVEQWPNSLGTWGE
jgi:RNA polymerase sigma factor (sigma-70 family)